MRKIVYRTLFCVILFCINVPSARVVTISGTAADTILDVSSGNVPVLKIVPVEACSVSIAAGCTEEKQDKYFAKTDRLGHYSITLNLPETCTYERYLFYVNGLAGSTALVPVGSTMIPVDSITDTLIRNLRIPHTLPVGTMNTSSYSNSFQAGNATVRGGDTINFQHVMKGLVDNPDTLHFEKCEFRVLLLTSSNDTIYDHDLACLEKGSWIYLKKNWYTDETYKIPVPKDLQKTNSTFARDRKLTLVFKFYGYDISYSTTITVIDSDIPLVNPTGILNFKKERLDNSMVQLSSQFGKLQMRVMRPGTYSIDLFALDGRMQQRIVNEQYFSAGAYVYDLSKTPVNASKVIIAKIHGNGISSTAIVNKL